MVVPRSGLGSCLWSNDRFDEAEPLLQQALSIYRTLRGDESHDVAITLGFLGALAWDLRELDVAESRYREALAIQRKIHPPERVETAHSLSRLGQVLCEKGEHVEAETLLREAIECFGLTRDAWGNADWARSNLGECLTAMGRYSEAEAELQRASKGLAKAHGETHSKTRRALERLVALYEAWGKPDQAAEWQARLREGSSKPR